MANHHMETASPEVSTKSVPDLVSDELLSGWVTPLVGQMLEFPHWPLALSKFIDMNRT